MLLWPTSREMCSIGTSASDSSETKLCRNSRGVHSAGLGTGIAYVLNYQIITSEGTTIVSTVTYLLPVVAIVLGVLVLGESVTLIVLTGIALVLAGVALTRRRVKAVSPDSPGSAT